MNSSEGEWGALGGRALEAFLTPMPNNDAQHPSKKSGYFKSKICSYFTAFQLTIIQNVMNSHWYQKMQSKY